MDDTTAATSPLTVSSGPGDSLTCPSSPLACSTPSTTTPIRTKLCGKCRNRVPAEELKSGRCAICMRAYRQRYRAKQKAARAKEELRDLKKRKTAAWRLVNRNPPLPPDAFEDAVQELVSLYGGVEQLAAEVKAVFEGGGDSSDAERFRLMQGALSLVGASERLRENQPAQVVSKI